MMKSIFDRNGNGDASSSEETQARDEYREGITVVLTAFKRIDVLRKQLEAIRAQTVQPNKIVLFQDKVRKDYTIILGNELLELFDDHQIAGENIGVWGRFDYARKIVDTEYVCIFDDDTIPGNGWLENCLTQMQINEGIYGTIGIVLNEKTNYPWSGYCRIGWARPNEETQEVDFAGHAWFLKTKWLEYMFDGTEDYRKYKYAAEDMTLSFSCLKHGIHTYVPPHPKNNTDMWGSMSETAMLYGMSDAALSRSGNEAVMNSAVLHLLNDGWEPLYIRRKDHVMKAQRNEKRYLRKLRAKRLMMLLKRKLKLQ